MAKIKITCDSACDLPRVLAERYRIQMLPMPVHLGEELHLDQIDVNCREACEHTEKTGLLPVISPVSPEAYRKAFLEYTAQGWEVIHISLSGAMSSCCCHAQAAARGLGNIHVVDSRSLSIGAGQLALLGAELAGADYRASEIVKALNALRDQLQTSFVLQQSQYLRRGSKPGGLSAFCDRLMHIKPQLILQKGLCHRGRPFRGDMEASILSYVRSSLEGRKNIQTDRIFLTYSQVPNSLLQKVRSLLLTLQPFEEILEAPAGSVIAQRGGPGCLGLSYLTCGGNL